MSQSLPPNQAYSNAYGGNFHRGEVINIVDWTLFAACFIVVSLRVISRTVLTRQFGLDDAIMIASVALLLCYVALLSVAISHGFGQHIANLTPEEAVPAGKYGIIASSLAVSTFAWPKLAIVALLQRLSPFGRGVAALFWVMGIGLTFCSLLLSIFWWAQCTPRAHQWDPVGVPGTCWNPNVLGNLAYFVAAFSAFLDIVWATYPLVIVHKLNMPLNKKIYICGALAGGYVAAIICIYKITLLPELDAEAKLDPTWADGPLLIFTTVEAATLILMGSLPTIGPFIRFVLRKADPSESYGRSQPLSTRKPNTNSHFLSAARSFFDKPSKSEILQSREDISRDDIHLVGVGSEQFPGGKKPQPNEIYRSIEFMATPETSVEPSSNH
ncbi:MAG: hypothetical protein M1828_002377 [Chrysothrix sp. TS-e1954]|nr:MAG: hypothetical protein M1828_002377 [Chrysothrix sp. TS-e1954]